ncbi:MAG: hypothetical protein AB1724_15270 [Thermodesulfobacteriota bacterium]
MIEIDKNIAINFLLKLMTLERKYSDEDVNKKTKRREELAELINNFSVKEIDNENQ